MTAPVLQFRVPGLPRTQGSKRPMLTRNKDPEKRRAILREQNSVAHQVWRGQVEHAAAEARDAAGGVCLGGPLRVVLLFAIHRPQRLTYPRPTAKTHGDVDKLTRAVFDALTKARVWADDSLVTDLRVVKDYPGERVAQTSPGVLIRIWHDTGDVPPSTGQIPLLHNEIGDHT